MRAMDVIWMACFRAALAGMKPKARLRYLKAVSEIIGDPAVVPCIDKDDAAEVTRAKVAWARLLPTLAGGG